MSTPSSETSQARLRHAALSDDTLTVELSDGRTISVPLAWYPRLIHGTVEERAEWRLIGGGQGLHWPALDEDISVDNLILGQPSGESQSSFKLWLDERKAAAGAPTSSKSASSKKSEQRASEAD